MPMARFWTAAISAFCLASLVWLAGLKAQIGVATPSSRWVFEVTEKKRQLADATPSPRALVVAGSGALFGLDAAALSRAWGLPVLNLAVNAGLGLRYILWQAEQRARPGDAVLLPLEYALFVDDSEAPNGQIIDYALARDGDYWRSLPIWQKLRFAAGLTPDRWWQGLRRLPDAPMAAGTYGGHHIDGVGDQTGTAATDQQPIDQAAIALAPVWFYGRRGADSPGGWSALAEFAGWAKARGICLVMLPSPFLVKPDYATDPVERRFYETLPARISALGIPYIGRPSDFLYPESWFFNTEYHLLDWARARHTERIIALFGTSPFDICRKMGP